jgi:putative oxygen-independent coproporphyrinogen III oxidase
VPFGVYVHVPFCASRCGYCDFNTYTATELGNSVTRDTFHEVLVDEIRYARRIAGDREVDTVFFGGGTPTLLEAAALNGILGVIRDEFGLAADAEITTEANPDSVDAAKLAALREGGFTRISLGMQSASSSVLRVLERTHTPGSSSAMAKAARAAGFDHVNLDLIYGTPGESDDDLRRSLDEVLDAGVDHVSAYSLIVEQGTPLARKVSRGEIDEPDDDIAAARYEIVDSTLRGSGFDWYEVSNWARPGGECRHNLAYWRNSDWWGVGPGAHGHIAGERWWNHKHPATYAEAVARDESPAADRERLTLEQQQTEAVMLGVRLAEGMPVTAIPADSRTAAAVLVGRGLLDGESLLGGRIRLTDAGRLLADAVVRELLG